MANEQNLKSWQPGQSGNPSGKPRGSKHLSTWIQEALEDEKFTYKLTGSKAKTGAPLKAIIQALVIKALAGDNRAFELLCKYGYGQRYDITTKDQVLGFNFNTGGSQFVRHVEDNEN